MKKMTEKDNSELVRWVLPEWAANLIYETIEMDSQSPAFDKELRNDLSEALDTLVETKEP